MDDLGVDELSYWYEYAIREPFGNEWFQNGLICSTIANCNQWGKRSRTYHPQHFMPARRTRQMSNEALHNQFVTAMTALGKIKPASTT